MREALATRTIRIHRSMLCVLLVACGTDAQPSIDSAGEARVPSGRPEALFEVEMWPGEGIPVVQAVRPRLSLVQFPRLGAPVTGTVVVEPGQRLEYDSTRFQTLRSVALKVRESSTIKGRDLGRLQRLSKDQYYSGAFKDSMFAVARGSALELLQYRAEGACFVRISGVVVDADTCPTFDTARFESRGEPYTLWWIHVRTRTASGWLQLSDSTAEVVRRTF